MSKKFVFLTAVFLIVFGFSIFNFKKIEKAEAQTEPSVSGYAWSENIGWVKFKGKTQGGDWYGVDIDPATGDFSGHAWSENIGWISFNRSETSDPPFSPFDTGSGAIAKFGTDCGGANWVCGWARALSACQASLWDETNKKCTGNGAGDRTGGWDGWIKLRGTAQDSSPYGVWLDITVTPQEFKNFAWGFNVSGWVSFNGCLRDKNGLAAGYTINENGGAVINDFSGNGNTGTLFNSPVWTNGKCSSALEFNGGAGGIEQYVQVPNSASLNITNKISIEAWIYPNSNPFPEAPGPFGDQRTVVAKEWSNPSTGDGGGYGMATDSDQTKAMFYLRHTNGFTQAAYVETPISQDKWSHVVGTFDKNGGLNNMKLYINGVLIETSTWGFFDPTNEKLYIGGNPGTRDVSAPNEFDGIIDEIRIYNRVLDANEISDHFNGYKVIYEPVNDPPKISDLTHDLQQCVYSGLNPRVASGHTLGISWTYKDPAEGYPQVAYEIQVSPDSGFSGPKTNYQVNSPCSSGSTCSTYYLDLSLDGQGDASLDYPQVFDWPGEKRCLDDQTIICDTSTDCGGEPCQFQLPWGQPYYYRIKVKDQGGAWSTDWATGSFVMSSHAYPFINFKWCPLYPTSLHEINFCSVAEAEVCGAFPAPCQPPSSETECYSAGGCADNGWSWVFPDAITPPGASSEENPSSIIFISEGSKDVSLTVKDKDGFDCTESKSVLVEVPLSLPDWKEIPPF
jgi:hypothetical protein